MNDSHFHGIGWSRDDIPIQIQGMKPDAQLPATYIIRREELDTDVLGAEMTEMTEAFMVCCKAYAGPRPKGNRRGDCREQSRHGAAERGEPAAVRR